MQNQGRSGRFQSFVSNFPGVGNAPTFSFTVPAGTIFKGFATIFARCAFNDTPSILNIQQGGQVYALIAYQGKLSAGSDYSKTDYIELPPGTYTSAWETLPAATGLNRVSIIGTCYYL